MHFASGKYKHSSEEMIKLYFELISYMLSINVGGHNTKSIMPINLSASEGNHYELLLLF